jgi:hypothetical protein
MLTGDAIKRDPSILVPGLKLLPDELECSEKSPVTSGARVSD